MKTQIKTVFPVNRAVQYAKIIEHVICVCLLQKIITMEVAVVRCKLILLYLLIVLDFVLVVDFTVRFAPISHIA